MRLATERCGRCGRALVSMEADPDAIRSARCPSCGERDERRRSRVMMVTLACTSIVVAFSAWQMLIA